MIAVAAMARNRVIGNGGEIPWHLPEDLRWFKRLTMGGILLMGRKTFESVHCKPLPNRVNIVVSRSANFPNVITIRDLAEFDEKDYDAEVFVIGGAEIYRQLLPHCTDLFLTLLKRDVEGDTVFPEFEDRFTDLSVVLETPEFVVRHYQNLDVVIA
jgi:dihydrofolate reductase